MNTPKEITINYLESIKKDRLSAIKTKIESAKYGLISEIETLSKAIKIVEESEGE